MPSMIEKERLTVTSIVSCHFLDSEAHKIYPWRYCHDEMKIG